MVFAIHQHESATGIHVSSPTPSWTSLPSSIPLGCRRAPTLDARTSKVHPKFPASYIKLALVIYLAYIYHSFLTIMLNYLINTCVSLARPHIFFTNKFSWSFPSILEKIFCSDHRQFAGRTRHSFPKRIFHIYPLIVPWTINCNTELWLKNVC